MTNKYTRANQDNMQILYADLQGAYVIIYLLLKQTVYTRLYYYTSIGHFLRSSILLLLYSLVYMFGVSRACSEPGIYNFFFFLHSGLPWNENPFGV